MNDRFKKIRLDNKMSQEEFGKKIGIESRAHISALEKGNRNITDRIINDVCREFNVREEWLRNGILPVYNERDGSFTELLSDLDDSDDNFIKNLIKVYMGLDKDSKDALRKIAEGMAEERKRQS